MADNFTQYLNSIEQALKAGQATEHTHRTALETLLKGLLPQATIINEPKRVECGAPDFLIVRNSITVGYVETKDIGANLKQVELSDQLRRYRDSLTNLILTDYLEFRWYVEGELRETIRLANPTKDGQLKKDKGGPSALTDLLARFYAQETSTLGRPADLARRMAALARMTRDLINETFKREGETGMLHAQLSAFRDTLIPDLTPAQFADMYAQTIAYGLFAARLRLPDGQSFTRAQATWNLPKTNPFLRSLFNEIAGPDLDERIAWIVDDLAHLLYRTEMAEILRDFGKRTRQEDPIVHFYETFLAAYDPAMRQARGVYYTPEPVVSYIVRSLDYLLKTHFNRPLGLADANALILDPAVGTATFLYFVIRQIHETLMGLGQAGAWNDYVKTYLLPRIFGFELLMAPYAVAHMKLGALLQEMGYDFSGAQRLGIYLTNALEQAITQAQTLGFAGFISAEANAAAEIKRDKPIMVILGNPPYSVSSANKGKYIEKLMERYKTAVRRERNIGPLSDDYIKFIRFAHDRIERTGHGLIGMITNHTYLSGLVHRGVREELLKSFSEIYLLNLHGNTLVGETAPDGGQDENVFDIKQGVSITILAKKQSQDTSTQVHYADLWGTREDKYNRLSENDISTTSWQTLQPTSPYFFFVPTRFDLTREYEQSLSITEIFTAFSTGVGTGRDSAFVAMEPTRIQQLMQDLMNSSIPDGDITEKYNIGNTSGWNFFLRRKALISQGVTQKQIVPYQYRPFDVRFTFYHPIIRRDQWQLMKHMQAGNLALLLCQQQSSVGFQHVFCTRHIVDESVISNRTRERGYVFPLYFYNDDMPKKVQPLKGGGRAITMRLFEPQAGYTVRRPNLSPQFISVMEAKLGLQFTPDGSGDLQTAFGPEDILHYVYAVLHSPTYRARYAEFLKIDFPRLPLTSNQELFRTLVAKGTELVSLHLMETPKLNGLITKFPVSGSGLVERVRYVEPSGEISGRIYINKMQYFEGVLPEVWNFQVGGYRVCEKWLKDRQEDKLSFDDLFHYQRVIVALSETLRLIAEIDQAIPDWPIE